MRLGKSRHKEASSDTEENAGLLEGGQGTASGQLSRASSQTSLSSNESQQSVSVADRTPTKKCVLPEFVFLYNHGSSPPPPWPPHQRPALS